MGDQAVTAQRDDLTNWFRAADKTSELVGQRQASTFQTLAALAGRGDVPTARINSTKKTAAPPAAATKKAAAKKSTPPAGTSSGGSGGEHHHPNRPEVGLTVRIEVNLPPGGDTATYDAIFASIKKHLMS